MPYSRFARLAVIGAAAALTFSCTADGAGEEGESPQHERHELMESVGKAAKPLGKMLKGESEFDAAVVTTSLTTFKDVASEFGGLFPPGSETGEDTEAAPAIWEDRAGFDEALANWQMAVDTALAANVQSIDEMKAAVGPMFKTCKGCHDTYRIED